jgi:hypothetical protein
MSRSTNELDGQGASALFETIVAEVPWPTGTLPEILEGNAASFSALRRSDRVRVGFVIGGVTTGCEWFCTEPPGIDESGLH